MSASTDALDGVAADDEARFINPIYTLGSQQQSDHPAALHVIKAKKRSVVIAPLPRPASSASLRSKWQSITSRSPSSSATVNPPSLPPSPPASDVAIEDELPEPTQRPVLTLQTATPDVGSFPPSHVISDSPVPLPSPVAYPSLSPTASMQGNSPRIPESPTQSKPLARALSYGPMHSSGFATTGPNDVSPDFQDSIAKHAEQIRKERQTRKDKDKRDRSQSGSGSEEPAARAGVAERRPPLDRHSTVLEEKPLVGNLIGEGHANYVLMYNMLTGIRIGVSRCQAKINRPLTDEDYTAQHKFSFDIVGNELTPSAKYDFKFKDYAPWVFRELREHFMLDPADYLLSLTAKYILSELGSPGKSGSFFYFSRDYRFIIKTIHHAEHKFLRQKLKAYYEHVKSNPHTLISRFYGLHRVKLPRGRKIHFVIMNNLMPPHRDIHETYDLKGSTVAREYPEDRVQANPHATLKDLNWLHRGKRLELGPEKRMLFLEQLKTDAEFLQALGIMDYSLLIGVHDLGRGNKDKIREGALTMFSPEASSSNVRRRKTEVRRERGPDATQLRMAVERSDPKAIDDSNRLPDRDRSERRHFIFYQDEGGLRATDQLDFPLNTIYYMGIIDILTPYGFKKCMENFFKGLVEDKHAISPVPPVEYGQRFVKFISSCVSGNTDPEKGAPTTTGPVRQKQE